MLPDLFIRPRLDPPSIDVSFTAPQGCTAARWCVLDAENRTVAEGELSFAAEEAVAFAARWPQARLWSVDAPYLYTLQMELVSASGVSTCRQRFGLRTIEARGTELLLNGEPLYVRGYIRGREAHEHPNLLGLEEREYFAKNIREAKRYGFNFIRFHSRIPADACFEVADELGMLIHIEIRRYYGKYQKQRALMSDGGEIISEADWREAILKLRNHPSLMVYCMGNEIRHPGTNPFVEHIADVTHEMDPTRLFIDTCAHGEFDRDYVDLDVQHMSYYFPFGKDYDMFENTYNWRIYGSAKGVAMETDDGRDPFGWRVVRAVQPERPVLAHEICHYSGYRDLAHLEERFQRHCPDQAPWWLAELRALLKVKGVSQEEYDRLREAARRWQEICWKLGIEAARRSPLLSGFHFLQLSDTELYENSNGLLDCFDDPTGTDAGWFRRFNGSTALLADLPRRTYFEGEFVRVPVLVSHFDREIRGAADLEFSLAAADGRAIFEGRFERLDMDARGRRELCQIELNLPACEVATAMKLTCRLVGREGDWRVENDWDVWLYPDRPAELPSMPLSTDLPEVLPQVRYPQLAPAELPAGQGLRLAHRFDEGVFGHLAAGGDVLMLYRVPETRERRAWAAGEPVEYERFYLPATWDRLKGVIWDRGHNCGAIIAEHPALAGFPHDGHLNLQFHGLVDDCEKICLDDFPVAVEPIIRGVDKPTRDRFDCHSFELRELQPAYTLRRFAYLFELRVGPGRLLVTGMNFTGLHRGVPEVSAMFESLLRYVQSDAFRPAASIEPQALAEYLREKGRQSRIRERKMTQYWQLDNAPLESDAYWKAADRYLREHDTPEPNTRPLIEQV